MKNKIIPIISFIIGLLTILVGIALEIKKQFTISIIGGADGPTSVFIAGKFGTLSIYGYMIAGLIVIISLFLILKNRKNKS